MTQTVKFATLRCVREGWGGGRVYAYTHRANGPGYPFGRTTRRAGVVIVPLV